MILCNSIIDRFFKDVGMSYEESANFEETKWRIYNNDDGK